MSACGILLWWRLLLYCQRPLNFVFCSESVRQCDSLGMENEGSGEKGRQLTWPASQEIVLTVARAASDSASVAATAAAVPPARSIFAFCVLSAVLYFSSSFLILYPSCPRPLFLFILSFCFRCISYAFRLLAFPLQVASQWRKKAAQCWHFTIHARRNWQRVTHFPACPQCCIPSESNNLQRKYPFPLLYKYICSSACLCVCLPEFTLSPPCSGKHSATMGAKIEWRVKWKLTFE